MLAARLNTATVSKHKSQNGRPDLPANNKRIIANIDERMLYVNTGLSLDLYKIGETDINFYQSIQGSPA